jgi:hypothetical protein
MSLDLALSVIASLFIAAALIGHGRIARAKATALLAIGAAGALAKNLLNDNLIWAGIAGAGLLLLTAATVSYSLKDQQAGEKR